MKRILFYNALLLFIILFSLLLSYYIFYYPQKINIVDISLNENEKIVIKLDDEGMCSLDNNNYINSSNKECIFNYIEELDRIYLKNKYDKIFKKRVDKDFTSVKNIEITNKKIYLAVNGTEKVNYKIDTIGKIKDKIEFSSGDSSVATVNNEGLITGISAGTTKISLKLKNKIEYVDVLVTSLIQARTPEYNYDRAYLKCNQYTKEQNDLLDEILKDRVNKVGYKTRAGVVEAARFIGLEFPYRIAYFSENGRLHPYSATSKVDGEGRYYHQGLYLNESRYQNISPKMRGPGTWGCMIYSNPSQGYRANGFDCSGFISWILLNGGFDSEDVGAGVSYYKDLTDLGEKLLLTNSINNNSIRAGDLLSGKGADGGHIALVVGMNNGYYYVAESLWYGTGYFGSLIRKYDINELKCHFYWHVDMNNYYVNDGNYTDYWM